MKIGSNLSFFLFFLKKKTRGGKKRRETEGLTIKMLLTPMSKKPKLHAINVDYNDEESL